ncbi:MAG: hypothetical protein ACR2FN_05420 [Chitinophagaceae bacterium]
MKKLFLILFFIFYFLFFTFQFANAQCSICTKTAQQLGAKPARGLNAGIIYLMFTPFAVASVIVYRWWKREKEIINQNQE